MRNFPFKAINIDTNKEEEFWYSRSMAAALFVFTRNSNGDLCVLANKRGSGCPDYQGCWCAPCGYLDFDETTKDCAIRECFEETGITIPSELITLHHFDDSPTSNRQNVTFVYYGYVPCDMMKTFMLQSNTKHSEHNEVEDIKLIQLSKISDYDWAFNHDIIIDNISKDHFKLI